MALKMTSAHLSSNPFGGMCHTLTVVLSILTKRVLPVIDHHDAHAWCAYGQAPESFENTACITYDGWGDNTAFKYSCFKGINRHSVEPMYYNFSMVYTAMAHSLKILHGTMDLDLPGKLMGLSAYGEVNRTWVRYNERFYQIETGGKYKLDARW